MRLIIKLASILLCISCSKLPENQASAAMPNQPASETIITQPKGSKYAQLESRLQRIEALLISQLESKRREDSQIRSNQACHEACVTKYPWSEDNDYGANESKNWIDQRNNCHKACDKAYTTPPSYGGGC